MISRFEDLNFDSNGLFITMNRRKQQGPKQSTSFLIVDLLMRSIVSQYIEKFQIQDRKGRLFRKLSNNVPTKQVIGINTISQMSKDIALWLGKSPEEAKKYTAHCWRRTGATFVAESGASLQQVKIAGGWKSDTIASTYIDNSVRMKRKIGEAISIRHTDEEKNSNDEIKNDKTVSQNQFNMTNVTGCHFHFIISPLGSPVPANVDTKQPSIQLPPFPELPSPSAATSSHRSPPRKSPEPDQEVRVHKKPRRYEE